MDTETSKQRAAALRMIAASLGTMMLLLVILALVRPDMIMGALHHMEAMVGMSTAPVR